MEHRWSPRKSTDRNAVIFIDGVPVAPGQLRNISQDGAFVLTRDSSYRRGMCLELEFILPSNRGFAWHRLPAVIMHSGNDGIGLMFRRFDDQAFQDIHAYLYGDLKHSAA